VTLAREIPEQMKPRSITIEAKSAPKVLEGRTEAA
jgi:hypothetical protein